jgi:hypothetical protein
MVLLGDGVESLRFGERQNIVYQPEAQARAL